MIILFSPAKTFRNTSAVYQDRPTYEKKANHLIKKLKKLSLNDLQIKMKVSTKVAQETFAHYQVFGNRLTPAIYTYYGQAFKSLDVDTIPYEKMKKFNGKICIMSGLYGPLRPLDGISKYRLEMKDKTVCDLYHYWKADIHQVLSADSPLINLASREYAKMVDQKLPIINITFMIESDRITKPLSMEVKTMRGAFLRHIILSEVTSVETLKNISILGYHYDGLRSDSKQFVFVKKT